MQSLDNGPGTHENGSHPTIHPLTGPAFTGAQSSSSDEYDALAELYLDANEVPSNEGDLGDDHPALTLRIEGMILGHLPVMGAAWPNQHARALAEETGRPSVIARLAGGELSLEVIGPVESRPPAATEAEAFAWVRASAGALILRVEPGAEQSLCSTGVIDRLAVLTGADDAAVVACYRALKQCSADHQDLPDIRLSVVGVDTETAQTAHARIARAARAFLRADLLAPCVVHRVAPTQSWTLYRGGCAHDAPGLVDALRNAAPRTPSSIDADVARPLSSVQNSVQALPRPETDRAEVPEREAPPSLTSLVEDLRPLGLACPVSPEIELAVDELGSLHLLASMSASLPVPVCAEPMRELLRARSWARTHRVLLSRATPQLAGEGAAADAQMHLFTEETGAAIPLAETPVRVHLLAPAGPVAFGKASITLNG